MNAFENYTGNIWLKINAEPLDIIKQDQAYRIFQGASPLLTLHGNEFVHASERIAQLIITDLMFMTGKKEQRISAPFFYAFQKDVVEVTGDPFPGEWEELLVSDAFVTIKTMGKFNFQSFSPEDDLFSFAFISLSALIRAINTFVSTTMSEITVLETDSHPFPELLRLGYSRLSDEKKVIVQALSGLHHSGIVLPLLLISGIISPIEYAKGLIALRIQKDHQMQDMLLDIAHARDYLECLEQRIDAGRQVASIIREGENETIEFKSTLRWDIRAGKTNQAVERACLKTITAFLNSAGGYLLIGIRDDGSVEGIESDKFVNEDKFLLHLWTLIRTCLGRDVSPYIITTLEKMDEKTICMVECRQSSRPVFLRQPGFDEAFYIRVGPSSNAMDISEALKYIADHFSSQ
ncbi:MAG: ATP-binding protein [Bacteroidetes bacterium]|nr:ATP-binding protein [Bacteroidota bacterium]